MFIRAARWRDEEAERRAMSAAWHTANLAGSTFAGKMPRYEKFVPPRGKAKPTRPVQAKAHLAAVFSRYPRKKKREPKP